MNIKVLTHRIRLSDGHVMADYIRALSENEADEISASLRRGEYDTDEYAVRIRRSPKSRHAIDVELAPEGEFIGSPRGFW